MKLNKKQYLGPDGGTIGFKEAKVVVLPFGYEGGVSYGRGTAKGPDAVIEASCYLELYDEELGIEPNTIGICTVQTPDIPTDGQAMLNQMYRISKEVISNNKFLISVGGDHSITTGYCRALLEEHRTLSVIQIDAHADLRDSYEGNIHSHASVMARIRELTQHTLQLGIRSISKQEAQIVLINQLPLYTMDMFRSGQSDMDVKLEHLPDPVFITFDVDVFDWSVVRSTGTPEPGGLLWNEALTLLRTLFRRKNVVGFDVVELAHDPTDPNSAFAVAKLIYKMIGYKYFLR
jgi:agmatinase